MASLKMASTRERIALNIRTFDGGNPDAPAQLLEVSIVGAGLTRTIVVLAIEPGEPTRLHRYVGRGNIELDDRLLDQIVLFCADRLMRDKLLRGPSVRRCRVPDGAKWLARQLPAADAATVIKELARHVDRPRPARGCAWLLPPPRGNAAKFISKEK